MHDINSRIPPSPAQLQRLLDKFDIESFIDRPARTYHSRHNPVNHGAVKPNNPITLYLLMYDWVKLDPPGDRPTLSLIHYVWITRDKRLVIREGRYFIPVNIETLLQRLDTDRQVRLGEVLTGELSHYTLETLSVTILE